jgi:hypothetical protein
MYRLHIVTLMSLATFAPTSLAQTTWYVDDDADLYGGGTSWTTAFENLQDALNAATAGDEIRVAGGDYVPSQPTDPNDPRTATFQLISRVGLYGGYAGLSDPNDPNARNVELYESVLSGDLNGDDGVDFGNNGENSYHVVVGNDTDETALLDGFTVTAGNADHADPSHRKGGGIAIWNGSPTISNCRFLENAGYMGAGIYTNASGATVTNCMISANLATYAGGIQISNAGATTLTNCHIDNNCATDDGGGLRIISADPTLTNCHFSGNYAGSDGGGIDNLESSPTLTDCTFSGNETGWHGHGGGI